MSNVGRNNFAVSEIGINAELRNVPATCNYTFCPKPMISSLLAQATFWLEPPASTLAQNHDFVFYALLNVMGFFFFLVVTIMLTFVVCIAAARANCPTTAPRTTRRWKSSGPSSRWGRDRLFRPRPAVLRRLESPPAGADVVDVVAKQWKFQFKYSNGAESNELYLLVDWPVVLKLTSMDVTHALYIPAFRVQRNAVPGRITELWFKPTVPTGKDPATGRRVSITSSAPSTAATAMPR